MSKREIYLLHRFLWDIRCSRCLIFDQCLEPRITRNLAKSYRLRLYVWHVIFYYGMTNCLGTGHVELLVKTQHINNRKYSNSYTMV